MWRVGLGLLIIHGALQTTLFFVASTDDDLVPECGVRNESDSWPFHVALYRAEGKESLYFCGGTIVSRRHVLVAAHCVHPYPPAVLSVRFGARDLAQPDQTERGHVERIIVHPEYRPKDFNHDVALLQLKDPIPLGKWAQPVCLLKAVDATPVDVLGGIHGSTIGWGIGPRNVYTSVLQSATVPVLPLSRCMEVFLDKLFENNEFFCAVTPVCTGSGGSGFYVVMNGRFYLRGFTTFGIATKGQYLCGVNTLTGLLNVPRYTEWIESHTIEPGNELDGRNTTSQNITAARIN